MIATFMQAEMAKQQISIVERERMRRALASGFAQNQVDVYVQNERELVSLWIARLEQRGHNWEEIEKRFEDLTGDGLSLTKTGFEFAKAHGATGILAVQDGKYLATIANDFRRSGNILGSYRIVIRDGRKYIIFRGYPGLRNILTAPRYGYANAKIVKLGIGMEGAKNIAKNGTLITVIISVTLNSIQWIFDEQYGWVEFVGNVSSDAVKAALASAAGILAYSLASIFFGSVAVVPLAAGFVVGIAASVGLYLIDRDHRLTERLIATMTQRYEYWKAVVENPGKHASKQLDSVFYHLVSEIGDAVVATANRAVQDRLRQLMRRLSGYPRVGHW